MQQIAMEPESGLQEFVPQKPSQRHFRTFRVVTALILRETGSRESRTSLGFLWTLINPIAQIIILTLLFSLMTRNPALGTNFPLFFITGVVPLSLFNEVSGKVAGSIRFSRPLLGFPAVTVLDAILARFFLAVFTNVTVFVAVICFVVIRYQLHLTIDMGAVVLSLTMAAALGLGIGTLNSVLFLAWPLYQSFWGMTSRPLRLASGVFFLINAMPNYIFQYLKWNPLAQVIGEMRNAFYPSYDISWVNPAYAFLIAGVTFTLGLVGLHRYVFDALEK